jgi:ubiquitin C-terminal hydrolase
MTDFEREIASDSLESHGSQVKRMCIAELKQSVQSMPSAFFQRRFGFKEMCEDNKELTRWKRFCELYRPVNMTNEDANLYVSTRSHEPDEAKSMVRSKSLRGPSMETALMHIPKNILETRDWKEAHGIGPGLQNLGNTCFMNSVLQCLTYCPPLVYHLTASKHSMGCRLVGFCGYCELEAHVKGCLYTKMATRSIAPRGFATHLSYICRRFRLGRQEDAHEFIRCLLDMVEKSYNKLHYGKDPSPSDKHGRLSTIVQHIFGGQLQSQVKCLSCNHESNTYDPFLDICLDIKNSNTIEKAFGQYILPEKLNGDNRYLCDNCHRRAEAEKQMTIYEAPLILTIQLKRFNYSAGHEGKIGKHVSFSETLNLGPYMSNGFASSMKYRLFAVLVHSGQTCNSGHYYCYVRSPARVWYCMNDESVYQTSFVKITQEPAYLLFYVLEKQDNVDSPRPNMEQYDAVLGSAAELKIKNEDLFLEEINTPSCKHGTQMKDINVNRSFLQDFNPKLVLNRDFQAEVSSDEDTGSNGVIDGSQNLGLFDINDKQRKSSNPSPSGISLSRYSVSDIESSPISPDSKPYSKAENSPGDQTKPKSSLIRIIRCHGAIFAVRNTRAVDTTDLTISKKVLQPIDRPESVEIQRNTLSGAFSHVDPNRRSIVHPHTVDGVSAFRKEIEDLDAFNCSSYLKETATAWDGGASHLNGNFEDLHQSGLLGKMLDNYDIEYDRGKSRRVKSNTTSPAPSGYNAFQNIQNGRIQARRTPRQIVVGKRSRRNQFGSDRDAKKQK